MYIIRRLALTLACATSVGCEPGTDEIATLKTMAAREDALNFLIVITGQSDNTDIPGVHKDPGHMIAAFAANKPTGTVSPAEPPTDPNNTEREAFGSLFNFQNFDFSPSSSTARLNLGERLVFNDNEGAQLEQTVADIVKNRSYEQLKNAHNANFITVSVLKAGTQRILNAIKMVSEIAAKYEGERVNSTAMVHMSSHGYASRIMTVDGSISLSQMAQASSAARKGKPWRRFFFVVDACESGGLLSQVDPSGNSGFGNIAQNERGSGFDILSAFTTSPSLMPGNLAQRSFSPAAQPLAATNPYSLPENVASQPTLGSPPIATIENADPPSGDNISDGFTSIKTGFAHQLIILASSQSTESSIDAGDGGAFTKAFTRAYKNLTASPSATIKQLFDTTRSQLSGMQHPVFKVAPAAVCQDSLKGSQKSASDSSALEQSGFSSCTERS